MPILDVKIINTQDEPKQINYTVHLVEVTNDTIEL